MQKRIVSLLLVLAVAFLTNNIMAVESHWAGQDLFNLKEIYQLEITGNWDEPADKELQERIFAITGLKIRPRQEMLRFRVLYYFVGSLPMGKLADEECDVLLRDFADYCDYCNKNNQTLGLAKKSGLLQGRKLQEGTFLAIDQPVTKAELAVFAFRYLKIKESLARR